MLVVNTRDVSATYDHGNAYIQKLCAFVCPTMRTGDVVPLGSPLSPWLNVVLVHFLYNYVGCSNGIQSYNGSAKLLAESPFTPTTMK